MSMARLAVFVAVVSAILRRAHGHGAVTNPSPRMAPGKTYCAWCVGEGVAANSGTGVHRDARLSSPCMGSKPGDAPYPPQNWGGYRTIAGDGTVQTFTKGGTFEATIVLDADHNGEAVWQFCPHNNAQTEECFWNNMLVDWTDVHSYWDPSIAVEHLRSKEHYPQTVTLPSTMPSGLVTLRWLWVCKNTNELFTSCIDANIVAGGSTQPQTPAPMTPMPTVHPTQPTASSIQPTPSPTPYPAPSTAPTPYPTPHPTPYPTPSTATPPPAQVTQCGAAIAGDCQSAFNNAKNQDNVAAFCNRCANEGGSNPLRKRCRLCCDECNLELVQSAAKGTTRGLARRSLQVHRLYSGDQVLLQNDKVLDHVIEL